MNFYYDHARNLFVYEKPSAFHVQQLLQAIPDAKQINGSLVAVPQTLRNSQILRLFNWPVAPIMADYDWPRHPSIPHPYETQKLQSNFMVLHPKCGNLSDMGCVDADTEFLSPNGWVKISKWSGEEVAQYDPNDESIAFVKAAFVKKPCTVMLRCKTTRGVDQLLSFDHRVLLANGDVVSAAELAQTYGAKNRWYHKFRTTFNVCGRGLDLTDWLIRLQIAVNADGYTLPNKTGKVAIRIKKERKIIRLRELLKQSQISYKERPCQPEGFRVFVFIPPEPKHCFEHWWSATQHQLEIIASELPHWDGAFRKNAAIAFYSTKKAAADFAQFAFSANGRRCLLSQTARKGHVEYNVVAKSGDSTVGIFGRNNDGSIRQNIWVEIPPDGFMYCFSVPSEFLLLRRNGCIFATGNTGKTLSTLWACDWIIRHTRGECRAIIVAPLSILQRVWGDAIFKNFLDKRTYRILYGTAEQRAAELDKPADFYIINFDGVGVGAHTKKRFELDGFSKQLSLRTDIRIAVVDEASGYKDSTTKRHRIARLVFGKKEYLWCLTGTPTPNAPTDAFGIAKLYNNARGKSLTSFKLETMYQPFPGSFKWLPKRDGYDKARALLEPCVRVAIDQVWDGPPLTTQQRQVELTPEQKKLMADLKRDFMVQVKSGAAVVAVNEAAARLKFLQISMGAIYDAVHKAHAIDAAPRYEDLERVLEEAPGKCLVFAPLTSVITNIYNKISKRWTVEIVNGEVSQKRRAAIFQSFQASDAPRIIVADPGTMAHGLDLYAAQSVIWFGPTDKPELYAQANARAHRPGQKHPVTVVQIVSNPLEREIFRRLENNLALQGALLDLVQAGQI